MSLEEASLRQSAAPRSHCIACCNRRDRPLSVEHIRRTRRRIRANFGARIDGAILGRSRPEIGVERHAPVQRNGDRKLDRDDFIVAAAD